MMIRAIASGIAFAALLASAQSATGAPAQPVPEARHQARGLPPAEFWESYTRHSKALVAIGDGTGTDRAFGLRTEFVALSNPYALEFTQQMRVQLYFEGQVRTSAQVEVFERDPDGDVTIALYQTDAQGIAEVPVKPGHDYLFDAVTLRPSGDDADAAWSTYWAALTFSVSAQRYVGTKGTKT